MANELTNDSAWLGDIHLVAIFDRALSAEEVTGNFDAGANPIPDTSAPTVIGVQVSGSAWSPGFINQLDPLGGVGHTIATGSGEQLPQ